MTIRPILLWPHPMLSRVCRPVGAGDVTELVADLFETMYAAPGRGLAAPQIGVDARVFVIDAGWKAGASCPRAVVDPRVLATRGAPRTGPEACLSIPGVTAEVARAPGLRLRWRDETGRDFDEWLTGDEAICAQHEIDHLDGRVVLDRIPPAARARLEAEILQ